MHMVNGKLYPILHCEPEDCTNMEKFLPDLSREKIAIFETPKFLGYLEDNNEL